MSQLFSLLLLLALAIGGCQRHDTPSAAFAEAHRRYAALYAEKLDDAFVLPEMAEVETILQKIPQRSADYGDAQALLKRIRDGRAEQQATEQRRQRMVEELRQTPPTVQRPVK